MFNLVRLRCAAPFELAEPIYDSLCVGRSSQNELITSDRLVSSSHARVFARDAALHVVDLDSRNGTEVNGERLVPFEPRTLQHGDVIEFAGRLSLRVEIDRNAPYPVIAVVEAPTSPPPASPADEGILRTLALPPGLTPALDAGRLGSLHRLITRLTDPLVQRNGGLWLEELTSGAARLLRVPEVLLVHTPTGAAPRVVHPTQSSLAPRRGTIEAVLRRRQAAAIDISVLDEHTQTLPDARTGTLDPDLVLFVPTLCGPIVVDPSRAPWGVLYTSTEHAGRRPFDDQDVWLCEALCAVIGHLMASVSAAQVLSLHRTRYAALAEHAAELALVGSSPVLGAALETLAALSDDEAPLLLIAADGTEPVRWATLLHRLSPRAGGTFAQLDLRHLAAATASDELESALASAVGGTILLDGLDALTDPACRAALDHVVQGVLAHRVRLVTTSRHTPAFLEENLRLSPTTLARLSTTILRIPTLAERPADLVATAWALLAEALGHDAIARIDGHAAQILAGFDIPNDLTGLRQTVQAIVREVGPHVLEKASALDSLLGTWHRRRADTRGTVRQRPLEPNGFHPLAPDPQATTAAPPASPTIALTPLADALRRVGLLG